MTKKHEHTSFKKRYSRYLYVLESNNYLKVGISYNPYDRVSRLHSENPESDEKFEVLAYIDCGDGQSARLREREILDKFKNYQKLTNLYGAKTECFSKDIKPELIKELDSFNLYHNFDPFITVSARDIRDFLSLNNKNLMDMCHCVGVKFTDFNVSRLKKGLSCILANISISGGKKILCDKKNIVNLSSGRYMTFDLILSMFSENLILNYFDFLIPNDMQVSYDVCVGGNLKKNYFKTTVRPNFLLTLYSYVNGLSDYLVRKINEDSLVRLCRDY
jgi:hypothetical protein